MKPARFTYERPSSLAEALQLLSRHGEEASILAGGQTLMPMLNLRLAKPTVLVDIKRIPGLDGIAIRDGLLSVGALTRHADGAASPLVRDHAPLLRAAYRHLAHAAVRNRGTFGGSLALADPAAELPACCVCLDAEIIVNSLSGSRVVSASEFFRGIYETALGKDELISRIDIPVLTDGWGWAFDEASRRRGDFAIAGVALGVRSSGGLIAECRIAFCGLEAAPRRISVVEEALRGVRPDDEAAIGAAVGRLDGQVEPLESEEYPGWYRIAVARALLTRGLARFGDFGAGDEA
jgi:carbon-monoxide dehydrogenase medium subunit